MQYSQRHANTYFSESFESSPYTQYPSLNISLLFSHPYHVFQGETERS
jgi:hypothetical protein